MSGYCDNQAYVQFSFSQGGYFGGVCLQESPRARLTCVTLQVTIKVCIKWNFYDKNNKT